MDGVGDVSREMYEQIVNNWPDRGTSQSPYEVAAVVDWAKEMKKRGHSIPICEIEANPNDPPDVKAKMDGKPIGIEVTRLAEIATRGNLPSYVFFSTPPTPDEKERILAEISGKRSRMQQQSQVAGPVPPGEFPERLKEFVHSKDKKTPRDGSLHKQFLLIVTEEQEGDLGEYMKKIALPRPQNLDAVYMMGRQVLKSGDPGIRRKFNPESNCYEYVVVGPNLGEEYYPVFEVCMFDSCG